MVTKWGKIARLGALPYNPNIPSGKNVAYGYYSLPLATTESTKEAYSYIYPIITEHPKSSSYVMSIGQKIGDMQSFISYNNGLSKNTDIKTVGSDPTTKLVYGHSNKEENPSDFTIYEPYDCITCFNINGKFIYQENDNKAQFLIIASLQTSKDIEINEIGCIKTFSDAPTSYKNVLIARNVLKKPLNLKANDFFTINFIMEV